MTSPSFPAACAEAGGVPPSKQAALLLHGVGLDDRRWLLGRLGQTARLELTHLLAELDGLGIAPANSRARAASSVSPPPGSGPADQPLSIEAMAAEVMARPIQQVVHRLHDEPDVAIGCLLRRTESGWTQRFLGGLDTDRRSRIERGLQAAESASATTSNALDQAVLQALLRRLAVAPERSPLDRLAVWKSHAWAMVVGWLARHADPRTESGSSA